MKLYKLPKSYNQEKPIELNIQLLNSPIHGVAILRGDNCIDFENMQFLKIYNDFEKNKNTVCVVFENQLFNPKSLGNLSKRIILNTAKKRDDQNYIGGCEWVSEENSSIFEKVDVKAKDLVILSLDIKTDLYNNCITTYRMLFKKDAPNLGSCVARFKNIKAVVDINLIKSPSVCDIHYLGYGLGIESPLITTDDFIHL